MPIMFKRKKNLTIKAAYAVSQMKMLSKFPHFIEKSSDKLAKSLKRHCKSK